MHVCHTCVYGASGYMPMYSIASTAKLWCIAMCINVVCQHTGFYVQTVGCTKLHVYYRYPGNSILCTGYGHYNEHHCICVRRYRMMDDPPDAYCVHEITYTK